MRTLAIGVISLVLLASCSGYPYPALQDEAEVSLDVGHEAHAGMEDGQPGEKPPAAAPAESDIVPLESIQSPVTPSVDAKKPENEVTIKVEEVFVQKREPEIAVVAEVSHPDGVKENVAAELQAVMEAVAAVEGNPAAVTESAVPAAAAPAIADAAAAEAVIAAGERAARAYGYPFNNYAGYGAWSKSADQWGYKKSGYYDLYGNYVPRYYGYGGVYPPYYYRN